jgi:hypothetical protein
LRVFFFFADFVGRSNGLAKAVAHIIRLIASAVIFFLLVVSLVKILFFTIV